MGLLCAFFAALLGLSLAEAKAVFAHFMVGNVPAFTVDDWESDMSLAQAASIDAFALNIASADSNNAASLANAFRAANNKGFKLFFSFDYAATGAWDQNAVVALIQQYGKDGAYWQYNNKPFVSTFEGSGQSGQWSYIKSATGCFFVPDYSSYGPQGAVNTGVVDGLFSWEAWPYGASDMSTSADSAYRSALSGRPYMMPVSPWYYTNLPSWGKNWLWRGDDLWFDRWQQVLTVQPEFVQIISWNDFGESHYIGPLHTSEFGLFGYGRAPYNYVENMPHDGWRLFLPYVISQYKTGAASISTEGLVSWYRLNPAKACSTGDTTGNSGPNGQPTVPPDTIVQDKIFYSALLNSGASVMVSIGGGSAQAGTWSSVPSGGSGIYHGSVPFNGLTGQVVITIRSCLIRSHQQRRLLFRLVLSCQLNQVIFPHNLPNLVSDLSRDQNLDHFADLRHLALNFCLNIIELLEFISPLFISYLHKFGGRSSCDCPCTCTAYGTQNPEPARTGVKGYPLARLGSCSTDPAGAAGC
ncbi:hypothetical protein GQ53DRAFT_861560 [Thozetella sp. PMI_491]|nr:hypothetical protein GQ53DRAFT_861560 [Thozetella sp. PMI_491]